MSAVAPDARLLLATRERWLIAAVIAAMVLPARAAIPLIAFLLGVPTDIGGILFGLCYLALVIAFVPMLADVLQRTVTRNPAARIATLGALAVASGVAVPLLVFLFFFAWFDASLFELERWLFALEPNAQTGLLFFVTTAGIVRSIQWYRASKELERERLALEATELRRTRRLVHETLRPRTIAEVLGRTSRLLHADPTQAERLVRRLARHCRRSLEIVRGGGALTLAGQLNGIASVFAIRGITVTIDAEGAESLPACDALERFGEELEQAIGEATLTAAFVELHEDGGVRVVRLRFDGDGAELVRDRLHGAEVLIPPAGATAPPLPRANVRLVGSFYTWLLAFLGFGAATAHLGSWREPDLYQVGIPVLMALFWPLAALPLMAVANRAVALRRVVAVPVVLVSVWLTGLAVTAAVLEVVFRLDSAGGGMYTSRVEMISSVLPYPLTRNVLVACAFASIQFAFAAGRRHLKAEEDRERVRREVASQEFRELEATIHPHFLFNALTSLLALIRSDPARAAAMCARLAALFTRTIATAGVQEWPLGRELELVTDYLAVQQIRFGPRLGVTWSIDEAARSAIVPRLLLQPLAENAVRHGAAHRTQRTNVRIEAVVDGGELRIEVRNEIASPGKSSGGGDGLRFVTARARAAGGTTAITRREQEFVVICILPARFVTSPSASFAA